MNVRVHFGPPPDKATPSRARNHRPLSQIHVYSRPSHDESRLFQIFFVESESNQGSRFPKNLDSEIDSRVWPLAYYDSMTYCGQYGW